VTNNFRKIMMDLSNKIKLSIIKETNRLVIMSCNQGHTLIVNEIGQVFSCGDNEYGQLGLVYKTQRIILTHVTIPVSIIAVAAGLSHSIAIGEGEITLFFLSHLT
jgi:alpha-tubulin suppressor-like RCC1 family protein